MTDDEATKYLAGYIIDWLCRRNNDELRPAIEAMRVIDHRLMHDELAHILKHGGHPPNWVPVTSGCDTCGRELGGGHAPGCFVGDLAERTRVKVAYPKTCKRCKDTGTIETGNNDLPCDCVAGDHAMFNTAHGLETGAQIKARRR